MRLNCTIYPPSSHPLVLQQQHASHAHYSRRDNDDLLEKHDRQLYGEWQKIATAAAKKLMQLLDTQITYITETTAPIDQL